MKVPLLLKEIEAKTEDPREKSIINKILQSKESSLRDLDDKMKWLKNFERLLEIQRNVVWPGRFYYYVVLCFITEICILCIHSCFVYIMYLKI